MSTAAAQEGMREGRARDGGRWAQRVLSHSAARCRPHLWLRSRFATPARRTGPTRRPEVMQTLFMTIAACGRTSAADHASYTARPRCHK